MGGQLFHQKRPNTLYRWFSRAYAVLMCCSTAREAREENFGPFSEIYTYIGEICTDTGEMGEIYDILAPHSL